MDGADAPVDTVPVGIPAWLGVAGINGILSAACPIGLVLQYVGIQGGHGVVDSRCTMDMDRISQG